MVDPEASKSVVSFCLLLLIRRCSLLLKLTNAVFGLFQDLEKRSGTIIEVEKSKINQLPNVISNLSRRRRTIVLNYLNHETWTQGERRVT